MYNKHFYITQEMLMRPSGRNPDQLREIKLTRNYTCHAAGSVLVEFGKTKVICTASIENSVPHFLKGTAQGWLTAEYGMLPSATHSRMRREASQTKQNGRTMEIQRLIGRALRTTIDLKKLGTRTLTIDCDVIQADGGTRTAAITGGYVALVDAIRSLQYKKILQQDPMQHAIASISVGVYQQQTILDMDYAEDSSAAVDMNIVMNSNAEFIEVQGAAEKISFDKKTLDEMLALAETGIKKLLDIQKHALAQ